MCLSDGDTGPGVGGRGIVAFAWTGDGGSLLFVRP